jgi:hypothetical protein
MQEKAKDFYARCHHQLIDNGATVIRERQYKDTKTWSQESKSISQRSSAQSSGESLSLYESPRAQLRYEDILTRNRHVEIMERLRHLEEVVARCLQKVEQVEEIVTANEQSPNKKTSTEFHTVDATHLGSVFDRDIDKDPTHVKKRPCSFLDETPLCVNQPSSTMIDVFISDESNDDAVGLTDYLRKRRARQP